VTCLNKGSVSQADRESTRRNQRAVPSFSSTWKRVSDRPNGSIIIHDIIVDAVQGMVVRVRDPWGEHGPGQSPCGTEGVMFLGDFLRRWSGIATFREL
jgi:hypothetical protein